MTAYTFRATLHPKRHPLTISNPIPFKVSVRLLDGSTVDDSGSLILREGLLTLEFRTTQQNAELPTLKLRAEETARPIVDLLGYLSGFFYFIDIESVTDDKGKTVIFGLGAQEIADAKVRRPITDLTRLADILYLEPSLPRILGDLRGAVMNANDTGFHCFRAMETMRAHFEKRLAVDRDASWEAMRRALRLDRSWFDLFMNFAVPQRHGDRRGMTAVDRVELLERSWLAVDRFIVFVERGLKDLPESEFEVARA